MKTFDQFLAEQERDNYNDWGIIHPDGTIISGLNSPKATQHADLRQQVMMNRRKNKTWDKEPPIHHYGDYLDLKSMGMVFRTKNNPQSIGAAIKGLKVLPSTTGEYHHEHSTDGKLTSGSETKVRGHMNALLRKTQEEERA